jgi:hypothetical protein
VLLSQEPDIANLGLSTVLCVILFQSSYGASCTSGTTEMHGEIVMQSAAVTRQMHA